MFCSHCGNEIPDGSVFCPSCGTKVSSGKNPSGAFSGINSESVKQGFQKASEKLINTAKNTTQRINEATNGKAGEFVKNAQNMAKETVMDFLSDVKQAVHSKDAKGFFTKNKFRNSIILLIAFVVIIAIIGSSVSYFSNRKYIKLADYETQHSFDGENVNSEIIGKSKYHIYILSSCKKNGEMYELLWTYDREKNEITDGTQAKKNEHTDWKGVVNSRVKIDNSLYDIVEDD